MATSKAKNKVNNQTTAMAETKSKTKKTVKVIKKLRPAALKEKEAEIISSISEKESEIKEVKNSNRFGFILKLALIVALGTVLYLLAIKYRNLFLVGTVNSSPITRWELNSKMAEKYGKQSFDEIVNERLLADELKKNKIVISDKEVSDEMAKLIKQYGGEEAFKTAISQFGLTQEKAKESIKQSLGFKKLVEKNYKIEITDASVKKYFDDNKKVFEGKKFEDVSAEIKDNLYQQEIYTKSQEWFSNVRKAAKIVSYL